MKDRKRMKIKGLPSLKIGDVIKINDTHVEVLGFHHDSRSFYGIRSNGTGTCLYSWAFQYKQGARIAEDAPTIAQLLEAANPHTQTALNTLRDVVPGEYRSVTGMVDYAREAIEERDASKENIAKIDALINSLKGGQYLGLSAVEKIHALLKEDEAADRLYDECRAIVEGADIQFGLLRDGIKHLVEQRDAAMKQTEALRSENEGWLRVVNNVTRMFEGAGFDPAPLDELVKSALERLDEQPWGGSELQILDKIIGLTQEHYAALDMPVGIAITARNIVKYVGNVVARCTNMEQQFDRLRERFPDCDGYIPLMDQAIEAIEFKRNLMAPLDELVIFPAPAPDETWDMVCCLMGLEPGSSAGDIIAAWAKRNPESAYQQGRADAYRDIAKGGE